MKEGAMDRMTLCFVAMAALQVLAGCAEERPSSSRKTIAVTDALVFGASSGPADLPMGAACQLMSV